MIDRYPAPARAAADRACGPRASRGVLGHGRPGRRRRARFSQPLGFDVRCDGRRERWLGRSTVPTFRVDVLREVDLIEEVGRHYGFDRLPRDVPGADAPRGAARSRASRAIGCVRRVLTAAGLLGGGDVRVHRAAGGRAVLRTRAWSPPPIANPLSEKFAVLRPSLLPGPRRRVRAQPPARAARRPAVRDRQPRSRRRAKDARRRCAWSGAAAAPHWSGGARAVDFFDVKGVVERCARRSACAVDARVRAGRPPLAVSTGAPRDGARGRSCSACSASSRRPSPTRAVFPRAKSCTRSELDLDAIAARQSARRSARRIAAALSVDRARPVDPRR